MWDKSFIKDLADAEINPSLYNKREEEIRRMRKTAFKEGLVVVALLFALFALVQIAEGIW